MGNIEIIIAISTIILSGLICSILTKPKPKAIQTVTVTNRNEKLDGMYSVVIREIEGKAVALMVKDVNVLNDDIVVGKADSLSKARTIFNMLK